MPTPIQISRQNHHHLIGKSAKILQIVNNFALIETDNLTPGSVPHGGKPQTQPSKQESPAQNRPEGCLNMRRANASRIVKYDEVQSDMVKSPINLVLRIHPESAPLQQKSQVQIVPIKNSQTERGVIEYYLAVKA